MPSFPTTPVRPQYDERAGWSRASPCARYDPARIEVPAGVDALLARYSALAG